MGGSIPSRSFCSTLVLTKPANQAKGETVDPQAVLDLLIDAASGPRGSSKGRAVVIREKAEVLAMWIERGGYLPQDPRKNETPL